MSAVGGPVVCVIGAGPAGLTLAHLLLRAQIPCVVLERHDLERLRARTRAGMIEHRTVVLLEPYGLAAPITQHGTRVGMCEFRADGQAFPLDYAALCDGQGHYIYPQHELVGEWAPQLARAGGDLRFGIEATHVAQDGDGATVSTIDRATGAAMSVDCQAVACCDGAAGTFAGACGAVREAAVSHPFRWLTVIAAVPPSSKGTIYGMHRRGFAGQMHRSPTVTRFMLEVGRDEDFSEWPDERIWAELQDRLAAAGRPPLQEGEMLERDILDHRVRVREPMQDGRVFLAGDVAHLITPAGGKGMNIAIQDAVELAHGLADRYGPRRDGARLAAYSQTRLPQVWRHQEFSNLMLSLFSAGPADQEAAAFGYGLRRARLDQLLHDPRLSRWFARSYVGIDE